MCLNKWGGIRLRPALMLDRNEREYPMCRASSDIRPLLSSSHKENLDMVEIYQKVNVGATQKVLTHWHDSRMENKVFENRRASLRQWMADKSLNQTDISTRTGTTRSYVSLLLSAGKPFGEKTARRFEKALRMPAGHLDKQGGSSEPASITVWDDPSELPEGVFALVPRVQVQLSAGNGVIAAEEKDMPPLAFRRDWLVKKNISHRNNLRIVYVKGDSMNEFLQDGDVVMIDTGQTAIKDNDVYAIAAHDEIKIKRLTRTVDGGVMIRSDNAKYPTETLAASQVEHLRIIGKMVWRGG